MRHVSDTACPWELLSVIQAVMLARHVGLGRKLMLIHFSCKWIWKILGSRFVCYTCAPEPGIQLSWVYLRSDEDQCQVYVIAGERD